MAKTYKISVTGMPFDVVNRRKVKVDGIEVGILVIYRNHNWGGRGTYYTFFPTEYGEEIGLEVFRSNTVKSAKAMVDSMLFVRGKKG